MPVNAKWAFSVLDLSTGKQLINTGNPKDTPFIPASLIKLFVAAAAVDMDSKEEMRMDTIIASDGTVSNGRLYGNLYIKGSGNAFLSEADMEEATEEISLRGIREITGDIIADDSLFDSKGWKSKYRGPAYASPGALGLNLHTVSITVLGRPPNIRIEPLNEFVKINLVPAEKPDIRQVDDLTYEVKGPITDATFIRKRFPLKDPAIYAVLTFKTLLKAKGIHHRGAVRKGHTPSGFIKIYSIKSKKLSEMVKDTNNNSLNVVAENLLLFLGAKKYGSPGTTEKGIMAMKEFLDDLGLSQKGTVLADGSGLSPENRITSEQVVDFLKKASEKPWFKLFYESIPVAGMEGTLKGIDYKKGNVRVKTGQLDNVYCMAGYIERKDKSKIAFSYLVNVPGADLLWKEGERIIRLLGQIADE